MSIGTLIKRRLQAQQTHNNLHIQVPILHMPVSGTNRYIQKTHEGTKLKQKILKQFRYSIFDFDVRLLVLHVMEVFL